MGTLGSERNPEGTVMDPDHIVVFEAFSLDMDRACRSGARVIILGKCMNRAFMMLLDTDHVDDVAW
jgi:hypothetical protein